MKRLLAFLISSVIIFLSVADGTIAFASEAQNISLYNFADNLVDMVREHDLDENATTENVSVQQFYASANIDNKYSHLSPSAFASKRLVVKSSKKIDYQGAADCVSGYRDLYILQYKTFEDVLNAYNYYCTLDYIDYVEPDYIMKTQGYFNVDDTVDEVKDSVSDVVDDIKDFVDEKTEEKEDTEKEEKVFTSHDTALSWASEKIGFEDIKEELEQNVKDDYIQVAVLDSGIDTDHELFVDRLIESDVNFSNSGKENSVEDDYGHGTHVAGIIVDNTLSNVKIKPYKVLNNRGNGSESLIAIAIDLAVAEGADIINMSLASDGEFQTMVDSVNNAVKNDVNVVVAAGNNKKDLSKNFISPACIESAFTVSATTKENTLSSYSNYNGTIDIAAPGDDIESSYNNGGYVKLSGTSMAAPQVAAGLAVVYTAFPDKTSKEAEEILQEYAITLDEDYGENKFGAGLLYLKYILEEKPRTAEPIFSMDSCTFSNSFTLTISCPEPSAKILYVMGEGEEDREISIDFINGEIYKHSLTISLDTTIYAVAIVDGKKFSHVVKKEYIRANESEEDLYDISSSGLISDYFGTEVDLIIPEKIRGKTVTGVSVSAFKDNSVIRSVTLPKTATKIYNEAFAGCTALESVTGSGITNVEAKAFKDSSISTFSFERVNFIGVSAFENCSNLKDVNFTSIETIQASAFKNSKGITKLNGDNLKALGVSAFEGTDIKEISIPNLTSINSYAFRNCSELTTVSIPLVKSVASFAFQNCTMLKDVEIPLVESIGASAFRNTAIDFVFCNNVKTLGNFAFAENNNLALVSLPKVTTVGSNAFNGCPELQVVNMPILKILANDSFANCPKLLSLWLPSVETVNKNALESSSLEYIQFDVVKTVMSLPKTLKGFVAPSSLNSITATIPENDFVVYGYSNTYAEQFATENNKQFQTVPAIAYDLEEQVNPEDTFILVYALGFNCKYQWYKNTELSNEGGTLIEGATNFYYEPTIKDDAVSYYCVITSSDGTNVNTTTTKHIANAPEFRKADYTEYNQLCEEYANIDRSIYQDGELEKVDEMFAINVAGLNLAQQDLLNSHIQKIRDAIAAAKLKYVLCDVNNDGKISVLDARLVLKAVVGSLKLDSIQILSADINNDGKITVVDSRMILKSVLK